MRGLNAQSSFDESFVVLLSGLSPRLSNLGSLQVLPLVSARRCRTKLAATLNTVRGAGPIVRKSPLINSWVVCARAIMCGCHGWQRSLGRLTPCESKSSWRGVEGPIRGLFEKLPAISEPFTQPVSDYLKTVRVFSPCSHYEDLGRRRMHLAAYYNEDPSTLSDGTAVPHAGVDLPHY